MASDSRTSEPVLDIKSALERVGGDASFYLEMADILLEDTPRMFSELTQAVAAQNAVLIRGNAHAIRGMINGCGGLRAAEVAKLIEDAGEADELSEVEKLTDRLRSELDELSRAINQFRTECEAAARSHTSNGSPST